MDIDAYETKSRKIKVESIEKKRAQYKQNRLNHVSRMEDIRHPKQLDYRPIGRRLGRHLKRLLEE
jgi:hypothetical protein